MIIAAPSSVDQEGFLTRLARTQPPSARLNPPGILDPPGLLGSAAIDETDQQLVHLLADDGRLSYRNLADAIGLSRTAARERLLRLQRDGVLTIQVAVAPSVLHLTSAATVMVSSRRPVEPLLPGLSRLLPDVRATASGPSDAVGTLRATTVSQLAAELDHIRVLDEGMTLRTCYWTDPRRDGGQPICCELTSDMLDRTDQDLMAHLTIEPRASYTDLGDRVGLSTAATRSRVLRLRKAGAFVVRGTVPESERIPISRIGFGITTQVSSSRLLAVLDRLATDLDDHPEAHARGPRITHLAAVLGPFDVVGQLIAAFPYAVHHTLDLIRATPGVADMVTWTYR